MKRKWYFGLGVLLLLAVLEMVYIQVGLGPVISVERVTVGDMVQTIVASGHVQNPHRIDISAQITSTVASVEVREGERVSKGQLLLLLDSSEARAGVLLALASVEQAQTHLRQLHELNEPVAAQAQAQAQTNLQSAENNLDRTQQLFDQAFVGTAAKEEAERLVKLARAQMLINQHQWHSVQAAGSEIASAQAVLTQATASVSAAKARVAYTRILAPRSGILIARHVEAGDGVQAGKVLLVLSPDGAAELVVQIDEKNMKWLRLEQPALASADAFADQVFQAKVVFINPAVDPLRGSVEVKLQVMQAPLFLTQDMTVSVDIEVNKRTQVLQIPMTALHNADKPDPWVLVVRGKEAIKVPVALGLQTTHMAEVLAGLQADEALVPLSETGVRDGSHLRMRAP